jgi:hypothetical protein
MSENKTLLNKEDTNKEDLFFKACMLDMAIKGIIYENQFCAIPGSWRSAISNFSTDFLNELELFMFGEPIFRESDES